MTRGFISILTPCNCAWTTLLSWERKRVRKCEVGEREGEEQETQIALIKYQSFLSVYDQWPFYLPVLEQNPREKPVITETVCIHILSHKCNCFLFVCASLCAIVMQSFIFLCAETFVLIFLICILFRFFSSLLRVEEQVLYAGKSMNQKLD